MDNVYFDEIHKQATTPKVILRNVGLILAAFLLSYIFLCLSSYLLSFTLLLIVGAFVGAIYLIKISSKEYEYIYTDGEIDIDMISGKTRRKRMITIKPETISKFEKYTQDSYKRLNTPDVVKHLDFSTGNIHDTYIILATINSTKTLILFSPSKRLLDAWEPILRKRRVIL